MVREREVILSSSLQLSITFVLPAGEALAQPPLSASLGQAQINSSDFCKQFNTLSLQNFYPGAMLKVTVFKLSDNSLQFKFRGLFLPFIFFQGSHKKRFVYIETLFDLYQIAKTLDERLSPSEFFGTLRSIKFKPIL